MLKTIVALLLMSSSAFAFQRVNANTVRVRILSYNIKGLPQLINLDWDEDRFKDIGDILAARKAKGPGHAPDIVLLQEAFGPRTVEVETHAKYPYQVEGPSDSKVVSSGLYVLSDFPIEFSQSILFGDFDCGTWDCFASKGAVVTRMRLPGVPFALTVGTTHVQSGEEWESPRLKQLAQLSAFVKSLLNPDAGLIIGGDFNTQPSQPSYHAFAKSTGFASLGEVCLSPVNHCYVAPGTTRTTLLEDSDDQFFYQEGHRVHIKPIAVERNFDKPFNGRMLSDHLGYETILEISWN